LETLLRWTRIAGRCIFSDLLTYVRVGIAFANSICGWEMLRTFPMTRIWSNSSSAALTFPAVVSNALSDSEKHAIHRDIESQSGERSIQDKLNALFDLRCVP
jgi:hypothetical protein